MPAIWRALTAVGSRLITRNTPQATSDASSAAASTPSFASSSCCAVEGEARDQQRDGEPDAGDGSAPDDHRPAQRAAQAGEPGPRREPRRADDAERLAHHVAEHDPERDRRGDRVAEQLPVDVDAGVCEREQRHDHEARPRVEPVLEPLVRGDRGRDAQLRRARELGRGLLAEGPRQLGHPLEVAARRRIGARDEPDREPGDHRIDPGLEQRHPDGRRRRPRRPGRRQPVGA